MAGKWLLTCGSGRSLSTSDDGTRLRCSDDDACGSALPPCDENGGLWARYIAVDPCREPNQSSPCDVYVCGANHITNRFIEHNQTTLVFADYVSSPPSAAKTARVEDVITFGDEDPSRMRYYLLRPCNTNDQRRIFVPTYYVCRCVLVGYYIDGDNQILQCAALGRGQTYGFSEILGSDYFVHIGRIYAGGADVGADPPVGTFISEPGSMGMTKEVMCSGSCCRCPSCSSRQDPNPPTYQLCFGGNAVMNCCCPGPGYESGSWTLSRNGYERQYEINPYSYACDIPRYLEKESVWNSNTGVLVMVNGQVTSYAPMVVYYTIRYSAEYPPNYTIETYSLEETVSSFCPAPRLGFTFPQTFFPPHCPTELRPDGTPYGNVQYLFEGDPNTRWEVSGEQWWSCHNSGISYTLKNYDDCGRLAYEKHETIVLTGIPTGDTCLGGCDAQPTTGGGTLSVQESGLSDVVPLENLVGLL